MNQQGKPQLGITVQVLDNSVFIYASLQKSHIKIRRSQNVFDHVLSHFNICNALSSESGEVYLKVIENNSPSQKRILKKRAGINKT